MTDKKDEKGELLPDEERLTSFGKMLRSTSLDELPELINMLKGDMSVVGPRPLLVRYLSLYNEYQARRHEVRPGFTGYAQVHGRNSITWEDKFDKDVYYVDHVTFMGDWKIIFQTVKTVLKREGISSGSSETMESFTGTSESEDVYYVDHVTFMGDWKIIFQTVKTVLKREGISSGSSETMESFTGTSESEDVSEQ